MKRSEADGTGWRGLPDPEPAHARQYYMDMTTNDSTDTAPPLVRSGRLVRRGGAFVLEGDDGRHLELRLMRVPIDHVGKSVAVTGHLLSPDVMEVDGVRAA